MRCTILSLAVVAVAAAVGGCHAPPPLVPVKPPVPVTVFRAEAEELAEVAAALNARVAGVYPAGPTVRYAAVSAEEAMVAVGCADATPECWSALADPISTAALLLADVTPEGRTGGVRVSLRMFDATAQKTLRLAERVYDSTAEAIEGVPDLVASVAAPREEP